VWSHTRGVYPLRATLAEVTGLPPAAITVRYAPGAGGFGAVGAEDAAADAALLAIAHPGRPVRVLWTREDEAANDPLAPAMAIRIEATLDEAGIPRAWATEIWSAPHVRRNGLLARLAMPDPPPPPPGIEPPPEMAGGATRNAVPLYAIPAPQIRLHLVEAPVRTGAFRSLGAFANIFAIESFLDELAEAAGADPLAFRLALLPDPRGRRLLERVAAMADWPGRGGSGTGGGLGLGLGRYKNRSAYAAVAARVSVDQAVRLERIWCAVDCGLVVNPDGVRNQIEGAIVQAASMALKEQVRMEGPGIASLTWEDYPILRFSEVPEIEVVLCGNPEDPALGVGEAAMGPTAAAIGNAVAHALGARLRDLPLTRERIAAALLA
jgi:CO/xanthine dehydrogenase Mo-binding subunit